MRIEDIALDLRELPGAMPVRHGRVDAREWRTVAEQVREKGGRLVALWAADETDVGAGYVVHAALAIRSGLVVLTLPATDERYPDISDLFPAASRMQRAAYDLLGLRAEGAADARKWLRHAAWPETVFPLRKSFDARQSFDNGIDRYPFVKVEGEGVHEIPVGPVHAGTIEPGHFRFSVVGEGILRLEERLGYKHKGVEKRFEEMSLASGAKLAGRISCDATVAYAWAYAMAVESALDVTPPPRALWLRALFLERERIGAHLWDLGFLGNDAGLAFGLAQFSRLREDWLRVSGALFGHRYLMDTIVPGGVACDIDAAGIACIRAELHAVAAEVDKLRGIYDEHAGLQDRFIGAGRVKPELAERLGLTGLAGRASAIAWDLRVQFPPGPYDRLDVNISTHGNGDVAARLIVRFDELAESLRLIDLILASLAPGEIAIALPEATGHAFGIGWIESWRGEVLFAVETAPRNRIRRAHPHDPSWQNWPLLERAVLGNIVPDFPLINKSFNLSYSGHDL